MLKIKKNNLIIVTQLWNEKIMFYGMKQINFSMYNMFFAILWYYYFTKHCLNLTQALDTLIYKDL